MKIFSQFSDIIDEIYKTDSFYIYIYYEFQLSRCRIFKIVIKSHRNTFLRYYNV